MRYQKNTTLSHRRKRRTNIKQEVSSLSPKSTLPLSQPTAELQSHRRELRAMQIILIVEHTKEKSGDRAYSSALKQGLVSRRSAFGPSITIIKQVNGREEERTPLSQEVQSTEAVDKVNFMASVHSFQYSLLHTNLYSLDVYGPIIYSLILVK